MTLIRTAVPSDVPAILGLIHDLAVYEKEPDAVKNTAALLHENLFGADPGVHVHVVDNPEAGGPIVGFALWFLNYSTWEGTMGIHLEDLYVRPEARGSGYGKQLLSTLAGIAVERGYARVEWSVLDWNKPSIDFYKSIGAAPMDGWHVYRLEGPSLGRFGNAAEVSA
ncbi:GNAT superfamily N-acetyltransferase [Arthrobacter silviterrae]|uniref:GNAT family N-acetyltransferase n=1 Tax=Arthrobacter silviterrae TaxID=2026658 RepID=A0ABX0D7G6_9MICC|nr:MULTISPECIES: GNAT family N-acetyltransferase [Arthrobacter]MCU6480876.1 GNAT family N-acetyltransferase [Arthrobacter sp. A2-55]MDQ0276111.1 GNAT superfamily N-acetyltransferase [Arthrobacter silviterrae]NGN82576.1 GNAT family N-acetyltransferase [Arthrobacter silviterrae]